MEGTARRGKMDAGFVPMNLPVCKLTRQWRPFHSENIVENLLIAFVINI